MTQNVVPLMLGLDFINGLIGWAGIGAWLKDPLIYYFAMLGKHFGMRQARIWLTFAPVKPPDLTGGVCASPCNLIVRDGLTY